MRRLAWTLLLVCAGTLASCQKEGPDVVASRPVSPKSPASAPGPALSLHFAGLTKLAADTNTAKFHALLTCPEALALRKQLVERLATTLPELLFGPGAARTNRGPLFRPLIGELLESEFWFSCEGGPSTGFNLAVQLSPEQRSRWSTNLWQAAESTPTAAPASWTTRATTGELITFGWTASGLMLARTGKQDQPGGFAKPAAAPQQWKNAFDLTVDLARLRKEMGLPLAVAWPEVHLTVNGRGDNLRSEATLKFADAVPWQLAAFRLPTNSVRDPLISFTAVQGFGGWLARLPEFKEWELKSVPNQAFTWARSDVPYNLHAAVPMPQASNTVVSAAPHALHTLGTNVQAARLGRIVFTTNRTEIGWAGMPILVPFVRPALEAGDDFLLFGTMAGIIPQGPNTNPPPAELLNQFLPRTNLVYYDWEITEAKLAQWVPILQLTAMLSTGPSFVGTGAASHWLRAVSAKLGNTITEVTATTPNELKAVRRSDLGLTALELALLARWLDNPAFPAFAYPTNAMTGLPPLPGAKK